MFKRKSKSKLQPEKLAENIAEKAVDAQKSTTKHFKRYFSKRTDRTEGVRRFAAGWLILAIGICLTSGFAALNLFEKSHTTTPADGGTYIEGIVGKVGNLNPLFNDGGVDSEVDRLVFNGLLHYDTEGKLTNDLAKNVKVSKNGKVYSITLRSDVLWHDGQPMTSKDVVFTIKTIQNPDSRSPLYTSWQGVKVTAPAKNKVKISLSQSSAPFAHVLTTPILPAHLLSDISNSDLRTASFNNDPIGTGPFVFKVLRNTKNGQEVELSSNKFYFKENPRVDRFIVKAFEEQDDLAKFLNDREITAAIDLSSDSVDTFKDSNHIRTVQYPLNNGVFAFFKTSKAPLSNKTIRTALTLATDRKQILKLFDSRYKPLKTPLLPGQIGYSKSFNQETNIKKAASLLKKDGWNLKDGVRTKNKKTLTIKLSTRDTDEYKLMAEELQRQWSKIGVVVQPVLLNQEQMEQTALSAHDYEVLLYGISIGADPDVFAYWHSSQARPGGLNFSEWKSSNADLNLEIARSKNNPDLRAARYQAFMADWRAESPAVALYQPYANYSYNQNAQGFKIFPLNVLADRLTNVEDWTVETRKVYLTP